VVAIILKVKNNKNREEVNNNKIQIRSQIQSYSDINRTEVINNSITKKIYPNFSYEEYLKNSESTIKDLISSIKENNNLKLKKMLASTLFENKDKKEFEILKSLSGSDINKNYLYCYKNDTFTEYMLNYMEITENDKKYIFIVTFMRKLKDSKGKPNSTNQDKWIVSNIQFVENLSNIKYCIPVCIYPCCA
jgi:hypothetical protein